MRRNILFIATLAAFLGTLFLIALSIALIAKGSAGTGIILLLLGTPCGFGLTIVFDYVRIQIERQEEAAALTEPEPIKPLFTKFGGG